MRTTDMKREIHKMIEEQNDPGFIKDVYDMLEAQTAWKKLMDESAARAEKDFEAGRVYTPDQVRERYKQYLKDR
ncbi:hypothetical protein [Dawidia soli]|uniref:Uncharacterized protein n=1 Tax=Dawidia soli TaxID=2782352 RepID=A0AAP2DAJ0_9BACT|nr:hypothetical protein [Dawidia soli]MBT1687536.1 hypothetical protein [Dawidia soli]